MKQIIILLLLLFMEIIFSIIIGTSNLSKQYLKNSIKGKGWGININRFDKSSNNNFYALKNVTISLNNSVTALIGPSGAGKTTLAKCLIGKEIYDSGEIIYNNNNNNNNNNNIVTAYIDHLFRQSYDEKLTIKQLFNLLHENYNELNSYKEIMNIVKLPIDEKITNLLESQRKIFEVIYGLLKAEINIIIKNNNDININNKISNLSYIIVLDEYLDKDVASVRSKFYNVIKMLSYNEIIQLQVMIITHSKSVLNNCCDKVIILKDGRLYFEGDPKKSIIFPSQLQMLD